MNICQSCSAYIKERVCKNGFPVQYGKTPMCLKEDFSDIIFKCFFEENGLPLLRRNYEKKAI